MSDVTVTITIRAPGDAVIETTTGSQPASGPVPDLTPGPLRAGDPSPPEPLRVRNVPGAGMTPVDMPLPPQPLESLRASGGVPSEDGPVAGGRLTPTDVPPGR